MNNKIVDAMNDISDNYIAEAHEPVKKRGFASYWPKLIVALGCICLLVLVLPNVAHMSKKESPAEYATSTGGYYVTNEGAMAAGSTEASDYISNNKMDSAVLRMNIDRKLIVNGSMNISTLEFDRVIADVNELANKYCAYYQSTSASSRNDSSRYFDATIRIPKDNYQDFVASLRGSANVSYYSEEVNDITDVYSDIDARLISLKAEEDRIREFYKDATSISELMDIEERLTAIRYEIDSLETRLHNYDVQIDYSTLNLSVNETKVYVQNNDSFASRIANSFTEGWIDFTYFIEDMVLFFAYNIFTIIFIAIAGFAGYRIYVKRKNRI